MKTFSNITEVKSGDWFYINSPANNTRMKVKCVWNDVNLEAIETVWYLFGLLPVNYYITYDNEMLKHFKEINQ